MRAPSETRRQQAAERLSSLATPPGALGRLGELGVWLAACQGQVPPAPVEDVRLVIFAGDHGVAHHGVSAFPPAITGAMVRTFLTGRAAVSALAATHGVQVRVLDMGVAASAWSPTSWRTSTHPTCRTSPSAVRSGGPRLTSRPRRPAGSRPARRTTR